MLAEFGKANDKLYESAWKSQFLSGLMMPVMNFVGNLGYVAVAVAGSIFAARGVINIGRDSGLHPVREELQPSPSQQLAQVSQHAAEHGGPPPSGSLSSWPSRRRIRKPIPPAVWIPASSTGHVDFHHVRFGYTPDKVVIHDFSCHVEPGQKVAIVGPHRRRTRPPWSSC